MSQSKSVRIIGFVDGDSNELDFFEADLNRMFDHSCLKDRVISVISIVGAFRTGKSFLLDFFLRYLYANYKSVSTSNTHFVQNKNWMGDKNDPLKGFKWQCGSTRITTGINMWSDVFLHDPTDGQKMAIVLMDTQGLFDHKTTNVNGSRIFCLSTLISSMQIYNIFNRVEENQLQYLQFATGFAKYLQQIETSGESFKPFQNLMFLIRDWPSPFESEYGSEGGQNYINEVLEISSSASNAPAEITSLREYIYSSFDRIESFLLPHPGKAVVTNKNYDGRWADMDEDFKEHLKNLVEHILSPMNLIVKKINGRPVKVNDFKKYVCSFVNLARSDTLPNVKSIFDSTIDIQMREINSNFLQIYTQKFQQKAATLKEIEDLRHLHKGLKLEVDKLYDDEPKMGTEQVKRKFKMFFDQSIEDSYRKMSLDVEQQIRLRRKALEAEQAATRIEIEAKTQEQEFARKLKIAQDERENQRQEFEEERRRERIANEAREAAQRNSQIRLQNQMDAMLSQVQYHQRISSMNSSMHSMSLGSASRSTVSQCNGVTQKGERCRNTVSNGSYCHYHR